MLWKEYKIDMIQKEIIYKYQSCKLEWDKSYVEVISRHNSSKIVTIR